MSPALPGTATFLFTDIEGSTHRWEVDRVAMSAALARHDALLHAAIEGAGGTVFKTVGDAFCAVFDSAAEGVAAALAAQRSLAAEDWSAFGRVTGRGVESDQEAASDFAPLRVRMALHAGEAEARDGDWFGPTVNRVARLLSAAHGGQVLVGGAAAELLAGGWTSGSLAGASAGAAAGSVAGTAAEPGADLPVMDLPGCRLRDLGRHRLKDLGRPERVWQLLAEGLAAAFPPIRSLDTHPHNLPEQASSFVGREKELAELAALLGRRRLVTVVGVGGSGKTRLAQHAAAECLQHFPDGAWFVDLAPIAAPELVAEAVATVLDPRDSAMVTDLMHGREPRGLGTAEAERAVAARLRGRRLLVILDNCEHLVDACAQMAAALARHAPGVTVLATSREPLRIPEETLWPIAPLGTADPAAVAQAADPAAELRRHDAARLLIDRARALQPDFAVTRANASALAEICQRLDGIPLALELAAARVRLLGPVELARRLDDRFRLLVGGSRVALPRQQTLRAMIDWSFDLLSASDKRVLCRLAVLAGPLPLAGALAVAAEGMDDGEASAVAAEDGGADGLVDGMAAMEALDSLVEKSLVVVQPREDGTWFRLLDTIRLYTGERLDAADGDRARGRLLNWLLEISRDTTGMLAGADMDKWLSKVESLVPNIRELVIWSAASKGRRAAGALLAGRFEKAWYTYGRQAESRRILSLLRDQGESEIPDDSMARLLFFDGLLVWGHHPEEAVASFQRAGRAFAAIDAQALRADALGNEGSNHIFLQDLERAEACFRDALALQRQAGLTAAAAGTLASLGEIYRLRGHWDEAARLNAESIALRRDQGQMASAAFWSWHNLGQIRLRQVRVAEGARALRHALGIIEQVAWKHWPDQYASCLHGLGGAAAFQGDGRRAARLMGAAEAILAVEHHFLQPADAADRDWNLSRARALLDEADWQAAWAEGQALTLEQAVAEGLGLAEDLAAEAVGGQGMEEGRLG